MVNTFLVHPDYSISAKILDDRRLGKQRVEAQQIIDAIIELKAGNTTRGWVNHPATRSWVNNVESLKLYFNSVVIEWVARGFVNNYELYQDVDPQSEKPYWVDCPAVHYSHMAQLIQKDPLYYCYSNLVDKVPRELLEYFDSMPSAYTRSGYVWPYKHSRQDLLTLTVSELAEPYVERKRCQHAGCRNKASYNDLCGVHRDKSIVVGPCQGTYKNGSPCRSKSRYGLTFCGSHGGSPVSSGSSSGLRAICQGICKTGLTCRNKAKNGIFCHVHIR